MATMIPQTIPFDAPESEKRIFNLLRDDPAAADWRIIWSHRPRQFDLESGRRREIDFLIIIPNRGILCLEVKGGQFDLRNGQWHPLGNANAIEPPDRQSEQAMFALRHELQQQFPHDSGIQSTPIDFAVAFTDWAWPYNLRPPTPLIYDKNVIDIPGQLTNRISEAARRMQNPVGRPRRPRRPNATTTRTLLDYLAPNFRLTAGPQLDIINQQLIRSEVPPHTDPAANCPGECSGSSARYGRPRGRPARPGNRHPRTPGFLPVATSAWSWSLSLCCGSAAALL